MRVVTGEWFSGVEAAGPQTAQEAYRQLWEFLHGPGSWEPNPWCWVLDFRVHRQNIDDFIKAKEASAA